MPYPNFHAARVRDPGDFVDSSFRSKELPDTKGILLVMGKLKSDKNGSMVAQVYRFPKDSYTVDEAKKWLKDNNVKYILFEPAKEEKEKKKESIEIGSADFSPGEFVNKVRQVFSDTFCKRNLDGSWPENYIKDDSGIFTDHVIARMGDDHYSIPFEVTGDDIVFASENEWTKVEMQYVPVNESVRIIEASDSDDEELKGWKWEVVIIGAATPDDVLKIANETYIRSKNGVPYSTKALEESVPLWDGIKVYDNHLTDEEFMARGTMRSVVNELVGVIVNPSWNHTKMAITGTLKVIDDKLRQKLLNAEKQDVLNSFGLSIDALCSTSEAIIDGSKTQYVDKIAKAFSVDVVADPAAGGRLARIIAGSSPLNNSDTNEEVLDMNKEELDKLIEDALTQAIAKVDERIKKLEAEKAEVINENPDNEPKEPEIKPIEDAEIVKLQESFKKSAEEIEAMRNELKLQSCRDILAHKLETSGLPDSYRGMVAKQYRDKVFDEKELDATIKEHREALSKLSESGNIILPDGANIHVSPLTEWDRYELAFLRLVAGVNKFDSLCTKEKAEYHGVEAVKRYVEAGKPLLPRVTRLSEWYAQFTEDYDGMGVMRNKRFLEANVKTTTLTSIVKNTVNLLLAADYSTKHLWWEPIVRNEDVDTLDQATLVRVYGLDTLEEIDEGEAYQEMDWSDEEETASWVKRGNYIGITLETFLMDKLGRLRSMPTRLANSWYNTISALVAGVFTVNSNAGPVLADNGALFNVTAVATPGGHANLLTAALSHSSFIAARSAMLKQTDQPLGAGKRMLVEPKYLLVPVDLENTALTIRNSEFVPGSANRDRNQFYEKFEVVKVPEWTDATDWALVADPNEFPAIWLIWLRGRRTPEIFSVEDEQSGAMFTNDEIRFKVRQYGFRFSDTYDCAPVSDFRPLHKSIVSG